MMRYIHNKEKFLYGSVGGDQIFQSLENYDEYFALEDAAKVVCDVFGEYKPFSHAVKIFHQAYSDCMSYDECRVCVKGFLDFLTEKGVLLCDPINDDGDYTDCTSIIDYVNANKLLPAQHRQDLPYKYFNFFPEGFVQLKFPINHLIVAKPIVENDKINSGGDYVSDGAFKHA